MFDVHICNFVSLIILLLVWWFLEFPFLCGLFRSKTKPRRWKIVKKILWIHLIRCWKCDDLAANHAKEINNLNIRKLCTRTYLLNTILLISKPRKKYSMWSSIEFMILFRYLPQMDVLIFVSHLKLLFLLSILAIQWYSIDEFLGKWKRKYYLMIHSYLNFILIYLFTVSTLIVFNEKLFFYYLGYERNFKLSLKIRFMFS